MSLSALGPFVMNTNEEISEAILDFRNAKNGFEGAKTWKSKIGNLWSAAILPFGWTGHSVYSISKAGLADASKEFYI